MELIVIRYLSMILSEIKDKGHILPHILSSYVSHFAVTESDLLNERSIEKITPFYVHLLLDQFLRFFIDAFFVLLGRSSSASAAKFALGNLKIILSEFSVWVSKRIYFWHALKFRREFNWRQSRKISFYCVCQHFSLHSWIVINKSSSRVNFSFFHSFFF